MAFFYKMFVKQSSCLEKLKNDTLKKICRTDLENEMKLILDTKTRWKSLISMLKQFLKLKNVMEKLL